MTFTVQRVKDLRTLDLTQLVNESEAEGYRFLSRLVNEYKDGTIHSVNRERRCSLFRMRQVRLLQSAV